VDNTLGEGDKFKKGSKRVGSRKFRVQETSSFFVALPKMV